MVCNVLVRTLQYFWKHFKFIFCPWKHKKLPSKVAYLWQFSFFFLCSPDCPKQPRIKYPFYRFLYLMICGTISGIWTHQFGSWYFSSNLTYSSRFHFIKPWVSCMAASNMLDGQAQSMKQIYGQHCSISPKFIPHYLFLTAPESYGSISHEFFKVLR